LINIQKNTNNALFYFSKDVNVKMMLRSLMCHSRDFIHTSMDRIEQHLLVKVPVIGKSQVKAYIFLLKDLDQLAKS